MCKTGSLDTESEEGTEFPPLSLGPTLKGAHSLEEKKDKCPFCKVKVLQGFSIDQVIQGREVFRSGVEVEEDQGKSFGQKTAC